MIKTKLKIPIFIGLITLAALVTGGALLLLRPKAPDPRGALRAADALSEQNLCLLKLLQEDPEDEASRRQLLTNYQILGADPLTIEAARQGISLPEEVSTQPEEMAPLSEMGGIRQDGRSARELAALALATDGETVYLAKKDGLYAVFHGIALKLSPAKAERMIPGKNGLYFLNASAKRVQYLARDGHITKTLSTVAAKDFAFWKDELWLISPEGKLYREEALIESELHFKELCAMDGVLYAASEEGIARIGDTIDLLLPSPAKALTAGDSRLYYIDENSFPAAFDPQRMEAKILKEKTALALSYDAGRLYYLNGNGKIKKIKSR